VCVGFSIVLRFVLGGLNSSSNKIIWSSSFDPVSACYRFDRGQGARSGVECSVVDATTLRQLLVTSFSCLNFGTWLPVSQESVCLFPLVSLLFLAFPISLAGFTQIPSVIHTQIYAMPRGDINWYCLTFFELQNQSLIHFN